MHACTCTRFSPSRAQPIMHRNASYSWLSFDRAPPSLFFLFPIFFCFPLQDSTQEEIDSRIGEPGFCGDSNAVIKGGVPNPRSTFHESVLTKWLYGVEEVAQEVHVVFCVIVASGSAGVLTKMSTPFRHCSTGTLGMSILVRCCSTCSHILCTAN